MIVQFVTSTLKEEIKTDAKRVEIKVGENVYLLSESIDGKLNINKSEGNDENLSVYPRYANVVELL